MPLPKKMPKMMTKYMFTDETYVEPWPKSEPSPISEWAREHIQKDICAGLGIPMSTFETKLQAEFFKTKPEGDPITSMVEKKLKAAITKMSVDEACTTFSTAATAAPNPHFDAETLRKIYEQIFALPAAPTTGTLYPAPVYLAPKPEAEPTPAPAPVPCRPFGEPSPRKLIL